LLRIDEFYWAAFKFARAVLRAGSENRQSSVGSPLSGVDGDPQIGNR
jgi:hypothetical protein